LRAEGGVRSRFTFALAVFLTRPQAEHQIGARWSYWKLSPSSTPHTA
jgi:hypothetical protein